MASEAASDIYPSGPSEVPEDLTAPGPRYARHAWLAMIGLVLFVTLYFSLAGWFVWTTYRYVSEALAGGNHAWLGFVMALPTAFLAVFMLKALFFVKHGGEPDDVEVTPEDEPRLFEFLHRLADEAGAPRPHRVFISPRVNAAVFYDLSIANLILPSKKNLEIGLGLVNVLTLSELKAVLAHEFGHFAQKSMAVGRWVYVAQQIAAHIIHHRDILDRFLRGLSQWDLRVAWVGWVLRLIVWSLRSLLETAFQLVILAQRALSREMEFQADLVSVSLTGSDALIHALHKLATADADLDRAFGIVNDELGEGRTVEDVFAIQTRISERVGAILDDDEYGKVPRMPAEGRPSHRVFDAEDAQPPRMWSTHPPNRDREDNAKARYVAAPDDERSAWSVFADPDGLRKRTTAHLFSRVETEEELETPATADTLHRVDEQFGRIFHDTRYRGAYLGRSIVRGAGSVDALFDASLTTAAAHDALDRLYPRSLVEDLERVRQLDGEIATLEALSDGHLKPADGVIRHRGERLQRTELADAIEAVREERERENAKLTEHDRLVRTVHRLLAAEVSSETAARHAGLVALHHYAEHGEAHLADARGELENTWAVITADGKISSRERKRLLGSCTALFEALRDFHESADGVALDAEVAEQLGVTSWPEAVGDFELLPPVEDNLDEWLQVIDSWVNHPLAALGALRRATLELLLAAESEIDRASRFGGAPEWRAPYGRVPEAYQTLLPGEERELQTKLGLWDRFQIADGLFPTMARLAVAVLIIGGALTMGGRVGDSTVTIYNGLPRPVVVGVGEQRVELGVGGHDTVSVAPTESLPVSASTFEGVEIETFEVEASVGFTDYVYNVAGATPLVRWTATYGNATERPDRNLGAPRWMTTDAGILFSDPPDQIKADDGGTREVLSGVSQGHPYDVLDFVEHEDEIRGVIEARLLWARRNDEHSLTWWAVADEYGNVEALLDRRLALAPDDVVARRLLLDGAEGEARASLCDELRARSEEKPEDGGRRYLAIRCEPDATIRSVTYRAEVDRYPKSAWMLYAAGLHSAEAGDLREGAARLEAAIERSPEVADLAAWFLARIERFVDDDPEAGGDLYELAAVSRRLGIEVALETGDGVSGPYAAFHLLDQGRLEDARQRSSGEDWVEARVGILAAASDGAPSPSVDALASQPLLEARDDAAFWARVGLGVREGQSLMTMFQEAQGDPRYDVGRQPVGMWRFVEAAVEGVGRLEAEHHLEGLDPQERGFAYSAAVIALGDRAPMEWRRAATRLLFATERPYFRLAGS